MSTLKGWNSCCQAAVEQAWSGLLEQGIRGSGSGFTRRLGDLSQDRIRMRHVLTINLVIPTMVLLTMMSSNTHMNTLIVTRIMERRKGRRTVMTIGIARTTGRNSK